jgi:hypothetical protein
MWWLNELFIYFLFKIIILYFCNNYSEFEIKFQIDDTLNVLFLLLKLKILL